MNLHDWIDELSDVLDVETEVDEGLILDLARNAAQNVQKTAAPITSYLVGFDNVPITALMQPALTTMAMPLTEFGAAAARLLEQQLARGGGHSPVHLRFAAELVLRESSLRAADRVG